MITVLSLSLIYIGSSVSVSPEGNFIAVGAPGDNVNVGATWVFNWNGSYFTEFGKVVGKFKKTKGDIEPSQGTIYFKRLKSEHAIHYVLNTMVTDIIIQVNRSVSRKMEHT